jgi:hypothetical protein
MDWLAHELLTGFQKLLCLGLDRTPATDLIDGTVMAWHEAITTGRTFDQRRDTNRIRVGLRDAGDDARELAAAQALPGCLAAGGAGGPGLRGQARDAGAGRGWRWRGSAMLGEPLPRSQAGEAAARRPADGGSRARVAAHYGKMAAAGPDA